MTRISDDPSNGFAAHPPVNSRCKFRLKVGDAVSPLWIIAPSWMKCGARTDLVFHLVADSEQTLQQITLIPPQGTFMCYPLRGVRFIKTVFIPFSLGIIKLFTARA